VTKVQSLLIGHKYIWLVGFAELCSAWPVCVFSRLKMVALTVVAAIRQMPTVDLAMLGQHQEVDLQWKRHTLANIGLLRQSAKATLQKWNWLGTYPLTKRWGCLYCYNVLLQLVKLSLVIKMSTIVISYIVWFLLTNAAWQRDESGTGRCFVCMKQFLF